jgi:hypothetical protein
VTEPPSGEPLAAVQDTVALPHAIDAGEAGKRRLDKSAERRLTEHFFNAMFDFSVLSNAGADAFKHWLLGAVGGLIAFGLLLTRMYATKYAALATVTSPDPYRRAVLGDDLFIIGFPMLLVGFVTLLVGDSLFPNERDFRILGPLPVRKTVVFRAKLCALLLFAGLFIGALHVALVPLVLLTSLNPWLQGTILSRLIIWIVVGVTASAFAVLAVTAIGGVLALLVSRGRFRTLTGAIRSGLFAALVLCLPLVARLPSTGGALADGSDWMRIVPPAWFVGLEQVLHGNRDTWFLQLAGMAFAAVISTSVTVAIVYAVLFRHFERLMMHSGPTRHAWRRADRARASMRALVPVEWPSAFRAVYGFTTLTFRRSPLHQGALVGLAASGAALVMNGLIADDVTEWLRTGGPPSSALVDTTIWAPFAVMFVSGIGVRTALVLPMEYRANWIFRLTEDETTRREQLRAVDNVVAMLAVGIPVAAAVPLLGIGVGWAAWAGAAVVALVGAIFMHLVLLDWRRIPFTCSYLPGKRSLAHTFIFGLVAYLVLTISGTLLVRGAITDPRSGLLIVTVLSLLGYALRRRRLAIWSVTPLMFEDEMPDQPQQLGL